MTDTLLRAEDCSFRYGRGEFELSDVSIAVRSGEVLGIVGPNGSGKSTLLRLLSGVFQPRAGHVLLDGVALRSHTRRELARRVAFLPQSPGTAFGFSVRQVVAMGRYPHQGAFAFMTERDRAAVSEALRETQSSELAARAFATLSGGEKQRVLIAGILAQQPDVMLLDEPTAALDIHHCSDVMDLLWSLSRKGIAVVAVTHDLNTASQFCDRLALLVEGRIARIGSPAEVLQQELLAHAYGAPVRVAENPFTCCPLVTVLGRSAHETSQG